MSRRDHQRAVAGWNARAQHARPQEAIHPAGRGTDDEYVESGAGDVALLTEVVSLGRRDVVMDFGAGDGRVSTHLADLCRVVVVDASPAMVEMARDRVGSRAEDYAVWDASTPWPGDPVDGLFSTAVFIHHTRAAGAMMLAHLADAVKPGGWLAVQVPLYSEGRDGRDWIDVTVWTFDELLAAADAAGCDITHAWWHEHPFTFDTIGENHRRTQVLRRRQSPPED